MTEPIRILHVFMGMGRSGVPVMLMNYFRHIDRTKVIFDFAVEDEDCQTFDEEIENLGGMVYSLGISSNRPGFYTRLGKVIRNGKYDIVHSHMGNRNIPILLWALFSGAKIRVSHSHNTFKTNHFLFRHMNWIVRWLNNTTPTHRFACSGAAGESMFGNVAYEKGKVLVINNAIEIDDFLYNPGTGKAVRNELGLGEGFVLGSVGNFTPLKNYSFMIDVMHELVRIVPSVKLVVAGGGSLMESIRMKISEYNLGENIMLLGRRSDVRRLYHAFDLLLLTSFYEGLSIALIEAQASGLRCLASSSITQESNPAGIMTFMDLNLGAARWAEEIVRLLQEPYERNSKKPELQTGGFDIIHEAKKLEEIYLHMKG